MTATNEHYKIISYDEKYRARKLGGVIHCFYGSKEIAQQYLKLGYHR